MVFPDFPTVGYGWIKKLPWTYPLNSTSDFTRATSSSKSDLAAKTCQNIGCFISYLQRSVYMSVCIDRDVFIYIDIHAYVYIYIYVCMHACMYVCMHACMYIYWLTVSIAVRNMKVSRDDYSL